jgi:hypothetical protein
VELVEHAGLGPLVQAAPGGGCRSAAEFLGRQEGPGVEVRAMNTSSAKQLRSATARGAVPALGPSGPLTRPSPTRQARTMPRPCRPPHTVTASHATKAAAELSSRHTCA